MSFTKVFSSNSRGISAKNLSLLLCSLALAVAVIFLFFAPSIVEVVKPVRGPAVQAVYATGAVEARLMLPVAPRVSAHLMQLYTDEGRAVTKGQVLAQLDDRDVLSTLDELRARAWYAEQEYERTTKMLTRGATSKEAADRAKAEWKAALAVVKRLEAELSFLQLTAPEDGQIIRRDGEIGQLISANQAVFWLQVGADSGQGKRITAEVDEEDIALVKPGQKVLIRADAFPARVFAGRVQSVTPKGDPVSRSYRTRIEFVGENELQIGMTAEINIVIAERENALLIPLTALSAGSVFTVENGFLVQKKVRVGAFGQTHVEILDGIGEAEFVVAKPSANLSDGQRVRVKTLL